MGQYAARIGAGLAITLLLIAHAARLYPTTDGGIESVAAIDNLLYDSRLRMGMKRGLDERIVILDIDETSLGELTMLSVVVFPEPVPPEIRTLRRPRMASRASRRASRGARSCSATTSTAKRARYG